MDRQKVGLQDVGNCDLVLPQDRRSWNPPRLPDGLRASTRRRETHPSAAACAAAAHGLAKRKR
eukprot:1619311-Amphidinium_carterae.1